MMTLKMSTRMTKRKMITNRQLDRDVKRGKKKYRLREIEKKEQQKEILENASK